MPAKSLKMLSLNIEFDKHLDRIIPFILAEKPDVILLQEVLEKDIPYFEAATNMKGVFLPLCLLCREKDENLLGVLTLSALPLQKKSHAYYRGTGLIPPRRIIGEADNLDRGMLVTEFVKDEHSFCFINTHFTWSPNGAPSEKQHEDIAKFMPLLANIPEFILCGDFNAPRGTIIFDTLAAKYKDNIPKEIYTTIDKNLHKAGALQLVVDGLFTTQQYQAESVRVVGDLSDHCAVLAVIALE